MEKKSAMVLVVVIGVILLGVVIAGKQSQDSLLKEVLKRQAEILKAQARIENQLLVPDSGGLSGILSRQQDLERRVAVLENLLRGPQAGGPQQAQRQGPPPEDYTKIYEFSVKMDNNRRSLTCTK